MVGNSSNGPLVAIVTPVFNGEPHLRKAMESVQAQTYRNIVHIVLDNASTDASARTIEEFLPASIPVVVTRNAQTLPLIENWNRAFSLAPRDAAYIKLLCADDVIHPTAIAHFLDLAESDPHIQVVLSEDVFCDRIRRANLPSVTKSYEGRDILKRMLNGRIGWLAYHHFFVRRDPRDPQDEFCGNGLSPDAFVVARAASRGRFGYIPKPLLYNRFHPQSVTGREVGEGGIKRHLVTLDLINRVGESTLGATESQTLIRTYLNRIVRTQLRAILLGRSGEAAALRRALHARGYAISKGRYVLALIGWPMHGLRTILRSARVGPPLDENEFSSSGASPA